MRKEATMGEEAVVGKEAGMRGEAHVRSAANPCAAAGPSSRTTTKQAMQSIRDIVASIERPLAGLAAQRFVGTPGRRTPQGTAFFAVVVTP